MSEGNKIWRLGKYEDFWEGQNDERSCYSDISLLVFCFITFAYSQRGRGGCGVHMPGIPPVCHDDADRPRIWGAGEAPIQGIPGKQVHGKVCSLSLPLSPSLPVVQTGRRRQRDSILSATPHIKWLTQYGMRYIWYAGVCLGVNFMLAVGFFDWLRGGGFHTRLACQLFCE